MRLSIKKLVFGGDGLAELNGKAVFVEGALPGETVEAELFEEHKDFARARIRRVLEASTERIEPPCAYAAYCGGCQYQHVSYADEIRFKEAQLKEIFARSGFAPLLRPLVASEREFGYRSSLTLHPVQPKSKASTKLGLVGRDGRSVIPVANCLLADARFAPIFSRELPARKCPERVTFKLDEAGRPVDDIRESFLRMRLGGQSYLVPSGGFFQTHPGIAERIVGRIAGDVAALKPDVLFDLFSGVGTFGLAAAASCGSVVFAEESPRALEALDMNLAERALSGTFVYRGRVEKVFAKAWSEHGRGRTAILLDPPRAGLEKNLSRQLAAVQAEKMFYLSCDPVTLERDLVLLKAGGWAIRSLDPFDMFPKTKHVEILASLARETAG